MSRRWPDGFEERVVGGNIRAIHLEVFADRGMTLDLAIAALERFHGRREDCFLIPSLAVQESVSYLASPA